MFAFFFCVFLFVVLFFLLREKKKDETHEFFQEVGSWKAPRDGTWLVSGALFSVDGEQDKKCLQSGKACIVKLLRGQQVHWTMGRKVLFVRLV